MHHEDHWGTRERWYVELCSSRRLVLDNTFCLRTNLYYIKLKVIYVGFRRYSKVLYLFLYTVHTAKGNFYPRESLTYQRSPDNLVQHSYLKLFMTKYNASQQSTQSQQSYHITNNSMSTLNTFEVSWISGHAIVEACQINKVDLFCDILTNYKNTVDSIYFAELSNQCVLPIRNGKISLSNK